jgi:tetratricopeptide (TPR) repeat protein
MRYIFFVGLIFSFLQSSAVSFSEANQLYGKGKFQEAKIQYEQLIKDGNTSWALYYNVGNCYYKTGDYASAILNFEKALRLQPGNENIEFNIRMAQLMIKDKKNELSETALLRAFNTIKRIFSADGWAWLSITFFTLSFISFLLIYLIPSASFKRVLFLLTFFWIFPGLISVLLAQWQYTDFHKKEGIVMPYEINVVSEPNKASTILFMLHSGSKVEIIQANKDWLNIKYDDDKQGWIKRDDLAMIQIP